MNSNLIFIHPVFSQGMWGATKNHTDVTAVHHYIK